MPSWADHMAEGSEHSEGYLARIRGLAAAGEDLGGEARLVNALIGRGAYVLDAGCGPGRVSGALRDLGHEVVGVDLDPVLVAGAREDYPGVRFEVSDLASLTPSTLGGERLFDAVVCAGNVLPYMESGTQRAGLSALLGVTREGGRLAVGFQTTRGYAREVFLADAEAAGWALDGLFSTWELHRPEQDENFVVGVFTKQLGH